MNLKYRAVAVVVSILCITALFLLYFVDPHTSRYYPKCIFHLATGWDCPGCGSGRAVHSFLHLRFAEGFYDNPILIAALPFVGLLLYLQYFGGKKKFPRLYNELTSKQTIIVVVVILLAYWICRNVLKF